jgi:hypothetical protein
LFTTLIIVLIYTYRDCWCVNCILTACAACYIVLQSADMSMEMASESMEIITMSVDKHQAAKNYEVS